MNKVDVAIVGAGIAGLSLAWHLSRKGKSVLVLEKSARAEGASVRNFGMVWVVGQPAGEISELAIRSRELWLEAAGDLGFWIRQVGSLHLAYEDLELRVLHEFLATTQGRKILTPAETLSRCPGVRSERLLGALCSESEAVVDPRQVVHLMASELSSRGIDIQFNLPVVSVDDGLITLATGQKVEAEAVVVCPGPEIFNLLPRLAEAAELLPCRLQMLRLRPKPGTPPIGTHLCAGLTSTHYANFKVCPSLPALSESLKAKWPLQEERGIHVLVAEHGDGTLTVGDSHAYGRALPTYREESTDEAILTAMDEFLPRENYDVIQRWEGTYNTHPTKPCLLEQVSPRVWALNLFGTGMTLSFGLTERLADELL